VHKTQAQLLNARAQAVQIEAKAVGSVELSGRIVRELDALETMHERRAPEAEVAEQRLKVVALIQQAGGEAANLINQANADRWARHMGERARLASYQGRLGSYTASPGIYRAFMYFDVLRESIADARVYIMDPVSNMTVRTNFEERDTGVGAFDPTPTGGTP
jgi:hypothetical protein